MPPPLPPGSGSRSGVAEGAAALSRGLEQALALWNDVRRGLALEQPPDPRAPLPVERPRDVVDRATTPVAVVATVAAVVLLIVGGTGAAIAALAVLLAVLALVARQGARSLAWQASRRSHRRAYQESLRELYDRYRVEVEQRGEHVVLRLRRYTPSVLAERAASRGRVTSRLYRGEVCREEMFGPDDELAAVERLAELQIEAEEREEAARDAYRRAAELRERVADRHSAAGDMAAVLREQLRGARRDASR